MKAILKGKIKQVRKADNNVEIDLSFAGKTDTHVIDAKTITMEGTLTLKPLIANELKIGSTLTITLTDQDIEE